MKRLVILISGEGNNLEAIINACHQKIIEGRISAVISHRNSAYGLIRAEAAAIETQSLNPAHYSSREDFDLALSVLIDYYQPQAILLAGYMRILSLPFVDRYIGKMLNVHPSLLPRYPGLYTHRQVLKNGETEHGASVHFVTEQLDGGPVVLQAKVPILLEDNEYILAQRVKKKEYTIYPLAVSWLLSGRLIFRDNVAWLDGKKLPSHGYTMEFTSS